MNETPKDATSPRVTRQNGTAIRVIREQHGLSQNRLARAVGIAQPSLSEIEGESVSARVVTLKMIAGQLGIPVAAIMRIPCADAEAEDIPEQQVAAA